jgi:hypothetical protein
MPSGYVRLHREVCNLAASPSLSATKASRSQATAAFSDSTSSTIPRGSLRDRMSLGQPLGPPPGTTPPNQVVSGLPTPTPRRTGLLPETLKTHAELSFIRSNPIRPPKVTYTATRFLLLFRAREHPWQSLNLSRSRLIICDHRLPQRKWAVFRYSLSLRPSLAAPDGLAKTRFFQRVA